LGVTSAPQTGGRDTTQGPPPPPPPGPPPGKGRTPPSGESKFARDLFDKRAKGGNYDRAGELNTRLEEALELCPPPAQHFGAILGNDKGAKIRFSDTAKDAFYSKTGDRSKGVPDNCITLPNKGKSPLDLLDGLIFETCNAEIQMDYDKLNRDLFDRLKAP